MSNVWETVTAALIRLSELRERLADWLDNMYQDINDPEEDGDA